MLEERRYNTREESSRMLFEEVSCMKKVESGDFLLKLDVNRNPNLECILPTKIGAWLSVNFEPWREEKQQPYKVYFFSFYLNT